MQPEDINLEPNSEKEAFVWMQNVCYPFYEKFKWTVKPVFNGYEM